MEAENEPVESRSPDTRHHAAAAFGPAGGASNGGGPLSPPDEAEEPDTSSEGPPTSAAPRGLGSVASARSAPGTTTPTTLAVTTVELYFQVYPGTRTTGSTAIGIANVPCTVTVGGARSVSMTTDADGRIRVSIPAGGQATVRIFDTDFEVTARSTLEAVTTVAGQQRRLLALGYDLGPSGVDGDRGTQTEAAILHFQADAGLRIDGNFGSASQAELQSANWMGE